MYVVKNNYILGPSKLDTKRKNLHLKGYLKCKVVTIMFTGPATFSKLLCLALGKTFKVLLKLEFYCKDTGFKSQATSSPISKELQEDEEKVT